MKHEIPFIDRRPDLPNRRQALRRLGGGLATLGLASALAEDARAEDSRRLPPNGSESPIPGGTSLAGQKVLHFAPRAKRVIQLFMNGGPFGPDFFDPKPEINRWAGQRPSAVELRTENVTGGLMAVPNAFRRHGESGLPVSDLLPRFSAHADDLCVLRGMYTDNPNHGPALFMMNNGTITPTRPSMGAWFLYGLGSENADLPGYVVLCPGRPVRFAELWTNSFLPGEFQGTYIDHSNRTPEKMIPFLRHPSRGSAEQRKQLDLLLALERQRALENERALGNEGNESAAENGPFEARMKAMETAFRMQFAATDAFDLSREPVSILEEYGDSHFSRGCLIARRLAERGVRFTQVYYGAGQPWDTHSKHNELTTALGADIDRPMAALLTDLKRRGMLDETLVIWGGEFGRTPTSESGNGRDHNHLGFTTWLAGGGTKGGMVHGATDEFGFRAVEGRVHAHDLHATILRLLGIDHTRLTFRYAGRDFRLTDVYGRVVHEILA